MRLALLVVLVVALGGCTSPLTQGMRLGQPASISGAPPPAPLSWGTGLEMTLLPQKTAVRRGEPVYLAVRLTNVDTEPTTVFGSLRPGDGFVEVYATRPDGRTVLLAPLSEGDFEGSFTLAPGATAGDVFPVFFGANGWYFEQPGEYRLFAELEIPSAQRAVVFRSASVRIDVEDGAAGQMLFAAGPQALTESGKFLLWRSGDHLDTGRRHLRAIAGRYPDAPLASYVRSAFARSYSEPFANYVVGEVRTPDCDLAGSFRRNGDDEVLARNLRIEDAMARARCLAEQERWQDARETLGEAYRLTDARPEYAPLRRAVVGMQRLLEAAQGG